MMARCMVVFLLMQLLPLCCPYILNCTVRQNGDLTYYYITDTSNVNPADCYYDWTNETNHVLANPMDQMKGLVVNYSINFLLTSKCINTTRLTGMCSTEDEERKAVCNTICHEGLQDDSGMSLITICPISVGLFLLVGLGIVCYKYRAKISSWCCCGQGGCLNPTDSMEKIPTDEPPVALIV